MRRTMMAGAGICFLVAAGCAPQSKVKELETERDQGHIEYAQLKQDDLAKQKQLQDQIATMQKQNADAKAQIDKLTIDLNSSKTQAQDTQDKLEKSSADLKKAQEDLATARMNQTNADTTAAQLKTAQASLETAQKSAKEAQDQVKDLTDKITDLQTQKDALAAKVADLAKSSTTKP